MVVLYSIAVALMQVMNILPLTASAVAYFSYVEEKESLGLKERIDTIGMLPDDIDPIIDEY